jgi:Leucine-rich repeat (LRR) protein
MGMFKNFAIKSVGLFLLLLSLGTIAQNLSPQEIRQKMADIRKNTDWSDPAAAKSANEQIKNLSKQLMSAGSQSNAESENSNSNGGNDNQDAQKVQEMSQAMSEHKMQVYEQISKAAAAGEGADILLAEEIRKDIVEAYKEDDDKSIKNPEYLSNMTYLYLDLSMPGIDLVIDAMSNFQNIKILVITSKELPSYTNVSKILQNASKFPLEELYIINLKNFFTNVPPETFQFQNLKILELFQNNIKTVPSDLSKLKKLETLMLDMNPLLSIDEQVNALPSLKELGIEKTQIPNSEVDAMQQNKPNLKISY